MKLTDEQKRAMGIKVTSELEEAFLGGLHMFGQDLPAPVREYKFHPERRWRFDFAWPEQKVAVEIQGGRHANGKSGHTSAAGLKRDYEKNAHAQLLGWVMVQFADCHLHLRQLPETIDIVRRLLTPRTNTNKGARP